MDVAIHNGFHDCWGGRAHRAGRPVTRARRRSGAPPVDAPADAFLSTPDDAVLAQRARTDTDAFGTLYDRYVDQIYRFVYRRLADRHVTEDVVAEIFLKAIKGIDGYRPEIAPFSTWLYRIATNAVIDHTRARRPTVSLDERADSPDTGPPVDEQAIGRAEAAAVWRAIDDLPPAQRTAVILRHGDDMSIAQIAVRMGRTEGAVKLLLNRGMAAVRARLGPGTPEGRP